MENFKVNVDPEDPNRLRVEIEGTGIMLSIWKREKGLMVDSYHLDYQEGGFHPPYSALFVPWEITDSEQK